MSDILLYHGDCLEEMSKIPDGSVDLVLTDPPYGTMNTDGGRRIGIHGWDTAIDPISIFTECSRILRQNGKAALFSQEPYTSRLITDAIASLPFSYRAIWLKNTFGNHLSAQKAMVSRYEDICVFSRLCETEDYRRENPNRAYFSELLAWLNVPAREIVNKIGSTASHIMPDTRQFRLCTADVYQSMTDIYEIGRFSGFKPWNELKKTNDEYKKQYLASIANEYPSVFNLWQGGKSKSNVLEYPKDSGGYHPTQKPVALLEDLIQTFSNEGDTVLDFTMGSGSTGVACMNTNRRFIGIELDADYFSIAQERIRKATEQVSMADLERIVIT